MKRMITIALMFTAFISTACAQDDKSKRPSPPAQNSFVLKNDTKVVIDYSSPAVKGRTIGKDIAPYGKVWRTGANEATTFDVSKDVWVEGQQLKAGKYALFTIPAENEWTIIFSKKAKQNGAFEYNQEEDALRVKVKPVKSKNFTERMSFSNNGDMIMLNWGDVSVPFTVK